MNSPKGVKSIFSLREWNLYFMHTYLKNPSDSLKWLILNTICIVFNAAN